MALRVPKAELPAGLRDDMIKQLGAVPEPVEVTYNNPRVAMSSQEFSAKVATWDAADASLKTFAHMAVAEQVGCSWAGADRSRVRNPQAYLIRVVTRQALNRLRTLSRSREEYVGEWLPEPLLTSADVAEDVELAESVSIAMLTVLETLTPTQRAVFVLREVFEMPYDEIAEATGKSAAAVRQIARRAREHVAARRPRMRVSRSEQQAVVERFLAALRTGRLQELMEVMAPDVVLIADGGGLVAATLVPVHGARTGGDGARARQPVRVRVDDHLAQRRARRPDRGRWRARRCEPGRGGRAGHPGLPGPEPAEADAAGRAGRPRQVARCSGRFPPPGPAG